jgi:glucokinase
VTAGAGPSAPAGVAYGIDIGGTKVLGVALDGSGQVLIEARVPTPTGPAQGDAVGRDVAVAVADVVAQLDAAPEVAATQGGSPGPAGAPPVGVGVPGMVDRAGHLRFSPNLPQAHGVDWHALLSEQLPARRFLIENDANLAALAEHRLGAAKGFDHVLMVTLGTGIGGALMVDGRILVGGHGYAGEIGHMVVDPTGPPCPCGRRGCWERYASGGGLGLLAREAALAGRLPAVVAVAGGDPESVRGEDVTAAAWAGDEDARHVVEELGWWVGFGLANLACVLDPERIVLGGGLVAAGELWLDAARAAYADLVEGGSAREPVDIVPAALGERAGAVGGAVAARQGGLW